MLYGCSSGLALLGQQGSAPCCPGFALEGDRLLCEKMDMCPCFSMKEKSLSLFWEKKVQTNHPVSLI